MNYLIRAAESKRLIVIWKFRVCNSKQLFLDQVMIAIEADLYVLMHVVGNGFTWRNYLALSKQRNVYQKRFLYSPQNIIFSNKKNCTRVNELSTWHPHKSHLMKKMFYLRKCLYLLKIPIIQTKNLFARVENLAHQQKRFLLKNQQVLKQKKRLLLRKRQIFYDCICTLKSNRIELVF